MPTAPDLTWGLKTPQAPAPSLFPRDDVPPPKSLVERHRPRTLSELIGQPCAVRCLSEYVDAPYPHAFLFEGPTGTGKSSAALALAHDLRVHPTAGLHRVSSGQQDGDALDRIEAELRFVPMWGWRLFVIEEADWMVRAPKVADRWLSMLDNVPTMTTFVFTTNHGDKLAQRFRDRCEALRFEADPATLMPDMAELVARVWHAEGCQGPPPAPEATVAVQDGAVSFRRAVAGLEPLVRAARSRPAPVRANVRSFARVADGSFRRAVCA
jgi:hypothetical protein